MDLAQTQVMAVIDEEFHPMAALADKPSRTVHLDWKGWSSPSLAITVLNSPLVTEHRHMKGVLMTDL